jgi:hypothetical protein
MNYDEKHFNEGSRWYDQELKQEVKLVYCRGTIDFRPEKGSVYGVNYTEALSRMIKLNNHNKKKEINFLTPQKVNNISDNIFIIESVESDKVWTTKIPKSVNPKVLHYFTDFVLSVYIKDNSGVRRPTTEYIGCDFNVDNEILTLEFKESCKGYAVLCFQ